MTTSYERRPRVRRVPSTDPHATGHTATGHTATGHTARRPPPARPGPETAPPSPRPPLPPAAWPDRHPILFFEIMPVTLVYAFGSAGIYDGWTADRIVLLILGLIVVAAIPGYVIYARHYRRRG